MIGALVMTHSDDNGLVCPPKLAPVQVVIVPIWKSDQERGQVLGVGDKVKTDLASAGVRVELDARDSLKPGAKYFEWEAKGVPLRLEIGPRDVAAGQVMTARRTGGKAPAKLDALAGVVRKGPDETRAGDPVQLGGRLAARAACRHHLPRGHVARADFEPQRHTLGLPLEILGAGLEAV